MYPPGLPPVEAYWGIEVVAPLVSVHPSTSVEKVLETSACARISPRLQMTDCPETVQLPRDGVALPKVTPDGRVSVTTTLVAVAGPKLVMVRVYVNG